MFMFYCWTLVPSHDGHGGINMNLLSATLALICTIVPLLYVQAFGLKMLVRYLQILNCMYRVLEDYIEDLDQRTKMCPIPFGRTAI